ncbi:MAG: universal stress protein [Chloroflexi bacterium]|nr:universal stress protein [Chloroflexota bacterium]MBP7041150.1 universal stress protein [Chloroflexota bacterium]
MEESNPRDYHQAVEDFRLARRQAVMQQVLARLRSESAELLSYDDVRKKLKMTGQTEQGIQEIPLDAIVGSVGRSGDYTRDFLPIKDSDKERWARVKAAFLSPTGVPPIAVYRVGSAYFVRDGNHRVSVARQLGNQTIDAYVTEVRTRVPLNSDDDPEEIILKERYANFLEKTNLDQIRPGADLKMTWPGFYSMLLEHIRSHQYFMGLDFQRDVSYEEAVGHWYDEVYMPVVALLYERGLFNEFTGRTEADLYALLADYRRELGEELGWNMDAQTAVTNLAETKSERAENVLSRMAGRLIDAMIPEKLEPGPQPGLWREERLEPLVPSAIFNDILVAVGGNDEQQQALDHALTLAGRANGRLFGLFVACPEDDLAAEEQVQQAAHIQRVEAEFYGRCQAAGVRCEFAVDWGSVSQALLRRSVWADLVVFSLRHPPGLSPTERLRSGLTPLLQSCSRPILAVPVDANSQMDRMLLAYDGSPKANEALFVATYRAARYGFSLVVVVVVNGRVTAETAEYARHYLADHGVEAEFVVKHGDDVGDVVLAAAATHQSNLLIMGGFGRQPFWRIMLGSLVDRMLRVFPQPILISR